MSSDDSKKDEQLPEWVKVVNEYIEKAKKGRNK